MLKERRPWEVNEAWDDLKSRGKGWLTRVEQGVAALDKAYPALEIKKLLIC